ncbi:MAG: hypothetical protein JRG76_05175 [Deltaproteobacteria bacterium]|nr:hypothetical protein [Deltaproteobacteria bacterium]MBW2413884.1 hypothetical protein [Deltaproteobacteria bacterium]
MLRPRSDSDRRLPFALRALACVAVAGLVASACGPPVPRYRQWSFKAGAGYQDVQLADNAFWVSTQRRDTGYYSTLGDFALLRAAELTMGAGFTHFRLVSGAETAAELVPPFTDVRTGLWNVVICFHGPPPGDGRVYVAEDVAAQIRKRHGISSLVQ